MIRALGLAALWMGGLMAMGGWAAAQARPTASGPGTSVQVGGGISVFQTQYGQQWLGATHSWVDINPTWRYGIEGEGRWLQFHQDANQTHQTTYLVGPRIVLLDSERFQPYAKLMAGAGIFSFPYGYAKGTYFVASGAVGVDIPTRRGLHIRAIEFEYQDWPEFSFGPLHPYGVSAGISYTIFRGATSPHGLGR